jgi:hypothetical protein
MQSAGSAGLRYGLVSDLPRIEGMRLALAQAQAQAPTVT